MDKIIQLLRQSYFALLDGGDTDVDVDALTGELAELLALWDGDEDAFGGDEDKTPELVQLVDQLRDAQRLTDPDWIAAWWHIDDVKGLVGEDEDPPTDDTCREVLRLADRYHDANHGINWEVLRVYLDRVK